MKILTAKLPPDLETKLEAEAKRRGLKKSAVVREALAMYMTDTKKEYSCLDLAGDLAGCVSGPADLSTHKKHLEGFGR